MRKLIAGCLVLLLIFVVVGCSVSAENVDSIINVAQKDFRTPEEAIKHFVDGITNHNLSKSLESCAINEYQNYDYESDINRTGSIGLNVPSTAPTQFEMYSEITQIDQLNRLTQQIKHFCYGFLVPELDAGTVGADRAVQVDNSTVSGIVQALDPKQLNSLKIVRIDEPFSDTLNSETNIERFTEQANIYGADKQTERMVLYDLNGTTYKGGFQLLRYGDTWKINNLYSILSADNVYGLPTEMTEEEYSTYL